MTSKPTFRKLLASVWKRLVAPGRYREVSAAMCWRVSLSRRAFEMLEPIAVKVARWVLRGGSGSNATFLPDLRNSGRNRHYHCFFLGK
jgi:hypothetical protein